MAYTHTGRFLTLVLETSLLLAIHITTYATTSLVDLVKTTQGSVGTVIIYNSEGVVVMQGSGFFFDNKGHFITNYHVIKDAFKADIKSIDGKNYQVVNIISVDEKRDLAKVLVNLLGDSVMPLEIAESIPNLAERIIVIGSPMGLEQTISDGIISSIRDVPEIGKILQITAPISPGSSGSPVINMDGKVVGIATSYMKEGQNLNFAIPGIYSLELKPLSIVHPDTFQALQVSPIQKDNKQPITDSNDSIWDQDWTPVDKKRAEELYNQGNKFLIASDYKRALVLFIKATEDYPLYAEAWIGQATCYGELGFEENEFRCIEKAIALKPDYGHAYFRMGLHYGRKGLYKEAFNQIKKTKQLDSYHPGANYYLGLFSYKLGNYKDAIQYLQDNLKVFTQDDEAFYYIGVSFFELNQFEDAISALQNSVSLRATSSAYYFLGRSFDSLGQKQEAIAAFKSAIRVDPRDESVHYGLGLVYFYYGNKAAALEEYEILEELKSPLASELFNTIYE